MNDVWHGWHFVGLDLGRLDKPLSHVDGHVDDCEVLRWEDGFLEDDVVCDNHFASVSE